MSSWGTIPVMFLYTARSSLFSDQGCIAEAARWVDGRQEAWEIPQLSDGIRSPGPRPDVLRLESQTNAPRGCPIPSSIHQDG